MKTLHNEIDNEIVQFMEDLAVFTVLNHSGPFGENFAKLKKN